MAYVAKYIAALLVGGKNWAWFKKGSFWVTKTIEDLPSFL
jgi:hypothetical protein